MGGEGGETDSVAGWDRATELSALLSSAALVLAGTVVGSGATLVERVVIGRTLSVDAYGRVSVGLALLTLGTTVSLFGLGQGVPRYMSRADSDDRIRGTWVTGLLVTLGIGGLLAALLFVAAEPLADRFLGGRDAALLRAFALAIPVVGAMNAGVAGIRGMENTRYRTLSRDLWYPLSRIGILVVLLSAGFGVLAAGYAYLLAGLGAAIITHALLWRLIPLVGHVETDTPELVRFSAPLVISSILSMLLIQTDTLVLGYFWPSSEVALYGAAYPLAWGLHLVLSAFGFIYLPLASRLDAAGDHGELDAVYAVVAKWVYVLTFPGFLAFVAFPRDVLTVFFGARYAGGAPALLFLATGFLINAAAGRNRQTLSALGHTTPLMAMTGVAFLVNLAANLALVPEYGLVGASVASAVSYTMLNVVVCAYLSRRFSIDPLTRSNVRTYLGLLVVLLPAAAGLSRVVTLDALSLPVFLVCAGLVTLAVVVAVGGLQSDDAVVLTFAEDRLGRSLPLLRRLLPDEDGETGR
jgi:O-antigen/teichoic acid export membrane protein